MPLLLLREFFLADACEFQATLKRPDLEFRMIRHDGADGSSRGLFPENNVAS